MRKTVLTMLVVILFVAPHLYAVTEWTHGDYTVGSEETYDIIKIFNGVTLSIYDGGEIGELWTRDTTLTNMYGGSLGVLYSYESSTVNLRGGEINTIIAGMDAIVHIYGLQFEWTPNPGNPLRGVLSGLWEDNTEFLINLRDCPPSDENISLHIIPEPVTFLLLLLGAALLKKRV